MMADRPYSRTFDSNSPDSDSKSLDVLCIDSNFHLTKGVLALLQGEGVPMIYIYIWLAPQQKIIWPHLTTTATYKTASLHAPQRPQGYLALPWQLLQTARRSYCSNGRHCTFQSARRSHLPSMDPEGRWARSIWWCHLSSPTSSVAKRVASLKALLGILCSIGGKRW